MATSGKRLDIGEENRVRRLRAAGMTIRAIASAERVSPTTVRKILKNPIAKCHTIVSR